MPAAENCSICELPSFLHIEILSLLPIKELQTYARCSKACKIIAEDEALLFGKGFIVHSSGAVPPARLCHTAIKYKDAMYIFGGDTGRTGSSLIGDIKGDLWKFSFDGKGWELIPLDTHLLLTEHTSVLYENEMVIFGGSCEALDSRRLVENVHFINLDKNAMVRKTCSGNIAKRSAHTAVMYKDSMYVYGGWDAKEGYGDWLHKLSLNGSPTWSIINNIDKAPIKCRAHSSVVHSHYLYIFGGYDESMPPSYFNIMHRFDFESDKWEELKCTGDIPQGRSRADMICYQDCIYLVGGWDRESLFSDLFEFNIGTNNWRKVNTNLKLYTKGIAQHKMVMHKHWLIIFGGYSEPDKQSTNRMIALSLRKNNKKAMKIESFDELHI